MKFVKQFEFHMIPEWSDYYLDYNLLKCLTKDYSIIIKSYENSYNRNIKTKEEKLG